MLLKCKKCRNVLLNTEETPLLSGHNAQVDGNFFSRHIESGECLENENSVYLQEEGLPKWIEELVNQAGWLKGKLVCPKCALRLGSFNFISGRKCTCDKYVLPPVHIIKSKVDCSRISVENPVTCQTNQDVLIDKE
ncbi:hypothetical protein O3M35_006686 [Rhynocoris fuscipes]|uniref:E3 ubiquitin-protein ligase n=1 Tax=Rhynocoris fuscipes TaxID=488301 RepID=A0AAW1DGQ5_9HEMI